MRNKQKNKKLSREAILSEAKHLFSIKGYKGTTLQDLTSSFGVSRPSIYYYYKSKMDILSELHSTGFNESMTNFDKILSGNLKTKEKFRKVLEVHTRFLTCDPEMSKIFYLDEMEMPAKLRKENKRRRKEYTDKIIEVYEKGMKEGIFKKFDPKMAVFLLLGACNWIAIWYSSEKRFKPDEIVETLMEILTSGYEGKKMLKKTAAGK
ncbi:MAG: TetR family transcriptional regulator [Spirochaetes bacterium]|nr:TetR family transcriptional regulator [Spirochaetota bacterium]